MPKAEFGPHHPTNELAQDGETAFFDKPDRVKDALASGSLGDACDRLGHRKNTNRAKRARELLDLLDVPTQNMIRTRVLAALASGDPFPFVCELPDDLDLKRVKHVSAREEVRDGRMVVVITTTSPGDD